MSRFLFVLPPFVGHVNPAVSLGRELVSRGHEAAWVSYPVVSRLLPEGDVFYPLEAVITEEDLEAIRRKTGSRWLPGLKAFWEDIILPLARAMLPGVEAAMRHYRPDVVIVDQQAVAGALAARRLGLPWITSSPTALMHSSLVDDYPLVREWIVSLLHDLQVQNGLEPVEWPDRSEDLIVLYTTQSMIEEGVVLPDHAHLIGPAYENRVEDVDAFPWDQLQDKPRVLVSLGTVNTYQGQAFFRTVVEAFRDGPLQIILNAPPQMLNGPIPDNFIARPWLPQLELLKHVSAVVSHAGSTVNEALAHGLPLVVVPVAYDNFIFAQQAVNTGAAVRLKFGRLGAEDLRRAVAAVLGEPGYREAARRIQAEFAAAGGSAKGASIIEQFASSQATAGGHDG